MPAPYDTPGRPLDPVGLPAMPDRRLTSDEIAAYGEAARVAWAEQQAGWAAFEAARAARAAPAPATSTAGAAAGGGLILLGLGLLVAFVVLGGKRGLV